VLVDAGDEPPPPPQPARNKRPATAAAGAASEKVFIERTSTCESLAWVDPQPIIPHSYEEAVL